MSSGFITESEVLEQRRQRQEEWDKVRTEDQPKEAPEEVYDTRPLYTRLEEQRLKKEAEYEEAHKLKNMIRGLDDDEVGFLDLVEQSKLQQQQQITLQEQQEMEDFRSRLRACSESAQESRLRAQLAPPPRHNAAAAAAAAAAQHNRLHGVIVRKRKASEAEDTKDVSAAKQNGVVTNTNSTPAAAAGGRRCVGMLPGLGCYQTDSSSDSDSDSDSDDASDKCCSGGDLLGRAHDHNKKGTDKS